MPIAMLIMNIAGVLLTLCGPLVSRVLIALGISYVGYTGAEAGFAVMFQEVKSAFGGVSSDIVNFLAFMYVDKALSVIASSYVAGLAVKSASGVIQKMVIKK